MWEVSVIDTHVVNFDDIISDRLFIRCTGTPTQAVVPEAPTQIASWTMSLFELFKGYEEEWTGRTRYNQGMQADSLNKTATGITAIMKAGSQRANSITKNFAEDGFKPMLKFLVRLNQQYMDQKQMIRVFQQSLEVAPDDIRGDLDIVVETDVGLEKKQQAINAILQYLREAFPTAMNLGVAGPKQFVDACVRGLELAGLSNARQYFMSEEEMSVVAERRAAEAGAGGGAGPGVPGLSDGTGGAGLQEYMESAQPR